MVTFNDEPPEISTSTSSRKRCFSHEPCRFKFLEYLLLEEVVYEIFLRLPVKSLIQFRCLSKGTRRMIDSPIFIKNHCILRSVISDDSDREYAIFLHQPRFHRLFSLNFDIDLNLKNRRVSSIELASAFLKKSNIMMEEVMGWCNGIFCFKNTSDDRTANEYCVFWNPSNGTFRKIECDPFLVSMGYDCVNDDYKLIRLLCLEARKTTTTTGLVEVYSFRKDSWRKLYCDYPVGEQSGLRKEAVCLNGVMHWLWINDTGSMFIAAFDLAKETFTKSLPLPSEAIQLKLFPSHFTDFRSRLCLTFYPPDYPPLGFPPTTILSTGRTMWVMEKYGVENSWSKLYHFGSIHTLYFPNSRSRLLCTAPGSLSWWDPQDGSEETIEIIPELFNEEAMYPSLYNVEPYIYVRNLSRLDQCS